MSMWQPIETAPKDGTKVYLHIPGRREPFLSSYADYWDCWLNRYGNGPEYQHSVPGYKYVEPTHWFPMPEPPK